MKLFTFARVENTCHGHGDYRDEEAINRFGPHFPPVFLSAESAKAWQEDKTNPLKTEDLLERFHWGECKIVELNLQAGLVTNVEKAALDLAQSLTGEDEESVDKSLQNLVVSLKQAGMMA